VEVALIAARAVHFTAALSLVGAIAFSTLIATPAYAKANAPTPPKLRHRLRIIGWASLVIMVLSAVPWLLLIAAEMSGTALTDLAHGRIIATVVTDTQFGRIWLLRLVLAGLLVPCLALLTKSRGIDGAATVLGAALVAALAWEGHAGAEEGWGGALHSAADAIHLVAAALWLGALLPLALLLGGHRERDIGGVVSAHAATLRFSTLGVISIAALITTGAVNMWFLVGTVPALIGTAYGQILLVKLALFLVMLGVAAFNRYRLTPRLARADKKGRAAIAQLRRNALAEAAIGLIIIALVGALGTAVPAAHEQPWWPFAYRFGLDAMADPNLRKDAIGTASLAILGLGLFAFGLHRRHALLIVTGLTLFLGLGWRPIQLLLLDATPTSYDASPVAFTAASIAAGAKTYTQNCVSCHGEGGQGDGPAAADLPIAPADLTAPHLFFHTDGDLFWFISKGLDDGVMPGFEGALAPTQRWELINFLKARADGTELTLNPKVSADPAPLAPDFAFAAAEGEPGSLRGVLAQRAVLLVLAAPSSAPFTAFEEARSRLAQSGVALLASADPMLRSVFALYDSEPLSEATGPVAFLIDRDGYIRARWHPGDRPDWLNAAELADEIAALSRLKLQPVAAAPTGHVH
jgi:putative copper resistance protein D